MNARHRRTRCWILGATLLALGAGAARAAEELPAYEVSDAGAAPVTRANLLENDRFWPYRVALLEAFQPEGRPRALPAEVPGVLIRVEPSGEARIDFGRDGLHTVPVDATDLLAQANQIRLGTETKMAPNLALDIGPRLLDPAADPPRLLGLAAVATYDRFLCVFADPKSPRFPELAAALAPLREQEGLLTVLFPRGRNPDAALAEQLRGLSWPVPFVLDFLDEPYADALLPGDLARPALLLLTADGRVLHASTWSGGADASLRASLLAAAAVEPREPTP